MYILFKSGMGFKIEFECTLQIIIISLNAPSSLVKKEPSSFSQALLIRCV